MRKSKRWGWSTVAMALSAQVWLDEGLAADSGARPWAGYQYQPPGAIGDGPIGVAGHTSADYWSGAYLGGTIGYGTGTTSINGSTGHFQTDRNGFIYSGILGANWRNNKIVYGLEGQVRGGNMRSDGFVLGLTTTSDFVAQGAVRGRVGYLVAPAMLVYGLAGVTAADFRVGGSFAGEKSNTVFWGGQFGVGTEIKMTEQVSVRLDYTYTDLASQTIGAPGLASKYDPSFHAIEAGVIFRF